MKKTPLFLLLVCTLISPLSFGALNAYMTIEGETQGTIEGSVTFSGREGTIEVIAFNHEVFAPRDASSGQPTGLRQHEPVRITKELDKATPKLMTALTTHENLTDVTLRFYTSNPSGGDDQYYTVILRDAKIVSIRQEMLNNKYPDNMQHNVREHVAFTYDAIEWIMELEAITSDDTWSYEGADIPISDLTGDGKVNLLDLAILANEWLYGMQ